MCLGLCPGGVIFALPAVFIGKLPSVPVQHSVMQPPKVIPCQVASLMLKAQHPPPCKEILMCTLHFFVTVQLVHKEE